MGGIETQPPGVEFWPEVGGRQDDVGGSTPGNSNTVNSMSYDDTHNVQYLCQYFILLYCFLIICLLHDDTHNVQDFDVVFLQL